MTRVGRVDTRRVVGVTGDGQSYSAIVVGAPGVEKADCAHSDGLESLAVVKWYSCTADAGLCPSCDGLVYRTVWTSPGWVSTKARITGELTFQALALAEERLTLRRWARR